MYLITGYLLILVMFLQRSVCVDSEKCIDDLTTYEHLHYYYQEFAMYQGVGTDNLICELCGIRGYEQIYIRDRVNNMRNSYARNFNKSDYYKVRLMRSTYLIEKMTNFYEPTGDQLLIDYIAPNAASPDQMIARVGMGPLFVKIYRREIPVLDITDLKMRLSAVIYYMDRLEDDFMRDIKYTYASVGIQCGYIIKRNDTHLIDQMMCYFNKIDLGTHGEVLTDDSHGLPCTNCISLKIGNITEVFKCGKVFHYLCEQVSAEYFVPVVDEVLSCPEEKKAIKIRPQAFKKVCRTACPWFMFIILLIFTAVLFLIVFILYFLV